MRKKSRAMDSDWALEVMHKAPYITVSFIDEEGKPYGLPLSLVSDDDVNWYFHGASFLNTWMLSTRASPVPYPRTAVVRITLTEPPTGKRKQYDKEGVEMKYGRME